MGISLRFPAAARFPFAFYRSTEKRRIHIEALPNFFLKNSVFYQLFRTLIVESLRGFSSQFNPSLIKITREDNQIFPKRYTFCREKFGDRRMLLRRFPAARQHCARLLALEVLKFLRRPSHNGRLRLIAQKDYFSAFLPGTKTSPAPPRGAI